MNDVTWSVFQKTLQQLVRNLHTNHNAVCDPDDVLTEKDFANMVTVESHKAWRLVTNPTTVRLILDEPSPPGPVDSTKVVVKRGRGRPRKILS